MAQPTFITSVIFPNDIAYAKSRRAGCAVLYIETQTFLAGSIVIVNGTTDEIIESWKTVVPDLDVRKVHQTGEEIFANMQPYPICDLPKLLTGLKEQDFLLGVITNDTEASTLNQLKKLEVLDYFDLVLGCDSGFSPKPDPDTIIGFCDKFGIDVSQAAMIGDSTHDLHAGRNANVGCNIAVLSGPADQAQLQDHADIILNDITEINSALLQNF